MAKKARKRVRAPKDLTRKQRSRLEREKQIERWLIWGVIGLAVIIAAILGYGYVVEEVTRPNRPVAIVDGVPITLADFQARVRLARANAFFQYSQLRNQLSQMSTGGEGTELFLNYLQSNIRQLEDRLAPYNAVQVGQEVMDEMIAEVLVRQEAADRFNVSVSEEELQEQIEQEFGYRRNPPTATPEPTISLSLDPTEVLTPTPTVVPLPTSTPMTEEAFLDAYREAMDNLDSLGLSEYQFRRSIESQVLIEKVKEALAAEIPSVTEHVRYFYVSLDDEEKAAEIIARLDEGEDLESVAAAVEEDEDLGLISRLVEWVPANYLEEAQSLSPNLAAQVRALDVGEHTSQPIADQGVDTERYYVFQMLEREEREIEPFLLEQMQEEAYQEWLAAEREALEASGGIQFPKLRVQCQGTTPRREEPCTGSWRDRDPDVCRWNLFVTCGADWTGFVPDEPAVRQQ